MSKRKSGKAKVRLTERALLDIADVEEYSIETWGKRVANRYLADIEAALIRLSDNPDLLRFEEPFHKSLRFYQVAKHLLVADVIDDTIFILTVVNAQLDIPTRLAELEPTLVAETELLHLQLKKSRK